MQVNLAHKEDQTNFRVRFIKNTTNNSFYALISLDQISKVEFW